MLMLMPYIRPCYIESGCCCSSSGITHVVIVVAFALVSIILVRRRHHHRRLGICSCRRRHFDRSFRRRHTDLEEGWSMTGPHLGLSMTLGEFPMRTSKG